MLRTVVCVHACMCVTSSDGSVEAKRSLEDTANLDKLRERRAFFVDE